MHDARRRISSVLMLVGAITMGLGLVAPLAFGSDDKSTSDPGGQSAGTGGQVGGAATTGAGPTDVASTGETALPRTGSGLATKLLLGGLALFLGGAAIRFGEPGEG